MWAIAKGALQAFGLGKVGLFLAAGVAIAAGVYILTLRADIASLRDDLAAADHRIEILVDAKATAVAGARLNYAQLEAATSDLAAMQKRLAAAELARSAEKRGFDALILETQREIARAQPGEKRPLGPAALRGLDRLRDAVRALGS